MKRNIGGKEFQRLKHRINHAQRYRHSADPRQHAYRYGRQRDHQPFLNHTPEFLTGSRADAGQNPELPAAFSQ